MAALSRSGAERRIVTEQGMLVAASVAGAAVASDAEQWDDPVLLGLLFLLTLGADRLTVGLGKVRISMFDLGVGLTTVIAGPSPAVAIVLAVLLIDALRHDLPLHATLTNFGAFTSGTLVAGLLVKELVAAGTVEPGGASFAVAAAGAATVMRFFSVVVVFYARALAGFPWRQELRDALVPLMPWDGVGIGLIAATAHAYATIGMEAVVALMVMLVFLRALLETIATAEQRGLEIAEVTADRDRFMREAIAAEERERRKIAAELHDDALQTLLAARADLVDGLSGDEDRLVSARDAVAETVAKLRGLMVSMGPAAAVRPIGPALREVAETVARRASFETDVRVEDGLERASDEVVVAVARELLVNAAKHSQASKVEVRVGSENGAIRLEVRDDGVGFDAVDRVESLAGGHIGLSLVEQRIAARGGSIDIASRPGGGTAAVALVPPMPHQGSDP